MVSWNDPLFLFSSPAMTARGRQVHFLCTVRSVPAGRAVYQYLSQQDPVGLTINSRGLGCPQALSINARSSFSEPLVEKHARK
jgi:hypothetical protein